MKQITTPLIAVISAGLLAGSVVGTTAQEEDTGVAAPVEVTANWVFGDQIRAGTSALVDGVTVSRGNAWRPDARVEASDPRLRGMLSIAVNANDYTATGGPDVASVAFRIENEEGVWQELPAFNVTFPGVSQKTDLVVLVGERGYEGLYAVLDVATDQAAGTWDLHGYIIDGELPPPPEPVVGA